MLDYALPAKGCEDRVSKYVMHEGLDKPMYIAQRRHPDKIIRGIIYSRWEGDQRPDATLLQAYLYVQPQAQAPPCEWNGQCKGCGEVRYLTQETGEAADTEKYCWRCIYNQIWARRAIKAVYLLTLSKPIFFDRMLKPIVMLFMMAKQYSLLIYAARSSDSYQNLADHLMVAHDEIIRVHSHRALVMKMARVLKDEAGAVEGSNKEKLDAQSRAHVSTHLWLQWILPFIPHGCKYCGAQRTQENAFITVTMFPAFITVITFPAVVERMGSPIALCERCVDVLAEAAECMAVEMYRGDEMWTYCPNKDKVDQLLSHTMRKKLVRVVEKENKGRFAADIVYMLVVDKVKDPKTKHTGIVTHAAVKRTPDWIRQQKEAAAQAKKRATDGSGGNN